MVTERHGRCKVKAKAREDVTCHASLLLMATSGSWKLFVIMQGFDQPEPERNFRSQSSNLGRCYSDCGPQYTNLNGKETTRNKNE
jgi:hypothetical protein